MPRLRRRLSLIYDAACGRDHEHGVVLFSEPVITKASKSAADSSMAKRGTNVCGPWLKLL